MRTWICLCALGAAAAPAIATTVTINPSKDNSIFEAPPLQPGGPSPDLSDAAGSLFAGGNSQQNPQGNAYRRRALLRFDPGIIPAGSTITSATLTLHVTRGLGVAAYPMDIHRMLAEWGEGTSNSTNRGGGQGAPASANDATWNYAFFGNAASAWATPGGDFSSVLSAESNIGTSGSAVWSGAGLVADLQSWVDGTNPNNGWIITSGIEFLNGTARRFSSREDSNPSFRPALTINYTIPAPAGAAAMLSGVLALSRRRR